MTTAPKYYKTQLVRGGPMAGLKIWLGFGKDPVTGETLERAWLWRAEVNGVEVDIDDVAPQFADGTGADVRGTPISPEEYDFYVRDHEWAKAYAPNEPAANPRKKVDMNSMPPIKW